MSDERLGLPSSSAIPRLAKCPGSLALCKEAPPDQPNEWSESGDRCHAALKAGNLDGLQGDDEKQTVSTCQTLEHSLVDEWSQGESASRFSERRIWLHDKHFNLLMSGKFDRVFQCEDRILIIDYKTGRAPVPHPRDNWQLKSELVMIDQFMEFSECTAVIIQPWVSPQIQTHTFFADEFDEIKWGLRDILWRASEPDAPRIPGAHCQFCRARSICPEANQIALKVLDWKNQAVSGAQLARELPLYLVAEDIIEARQNLAKEILSASPNAIPGWELQPGREPETIDDSFAAFNKSEFSASEFERCFRFSLSEFRKLYAKKMKCNSEDAKIACREIFGDLIKTTQQKPILKKI